MKYILNGRVFEQTSYTDQYRHEPENDGDKTVYLWKEDLILLGATPCGKCGEREDVCSCCALPQSECECKVLESKEEKIEMPESNMIGAVVDDDGRVECSSYLHDWMVSITNKVKHQEK